MKLEVFILGGQKIDQEEKEGMVERLGEMREERGEQREDRDRERDKRELR